MAKPKTLKYIALSLLLICLLLGGFLIYDKQSEPALKLEGWINCMPVLSAEQSELCRKAEAQNYPYIAY